VLAVILVLGVLGTARAVTGAGVAAHPGQARRRSSLASALARAGCPPQLVAGVRMALLGGARPTALPARATLVAAILAVGVGGAALTFATSLQHLLDTPRLYGQTWDFELGGGGPSIDAATIRRVSRDPAVSDVAVGAVELVDVGGQAVGARAMDDVKGSSPPTVLDGRAPGEVLLGTKTFDALDVSIGDRVAVRRGPRAVGLRIVGRGVLPSTKFNKLSEGAAFSFHDLKQIRPEAAAYALQAHVPPGADRDAATICGCGRNGAEGVMRRRTLETRRCAGRALGGRAAARAREPELAQ
jgi:hypothetical protein